MIVRALQEADLPEVLRLERQAMPDPWNEEELSAEMHAANGVRMVAEQDGRICGYALFRTCFPESELLRLAVAPDCRRQGAGRALLEDALAVFSGQGYATCFLEVRASNEEARRFYGKAGFLQVGLRKKYYQQPVEDALLLCRNLIEVKEETH